MANDSIDSTLPTVPPYQLERRGVVLRPDLSNPYEQGGVLNPAAVLHNGVTFLLYRAVATVPPNYSRILIATCSFGPHGEIQAKKLNRVALEPYASYELLADGQGGGVEDPRVTLLDGVYYMTYTAYGTLNAVATPRIAIAKSHDLFAWERLGIPHFQVNAKGDPRLSGYDLNQVPNKDAILFPEQIDGRYCMMHRPMFPQASGLRQSIWISWSEDLLYWTDHSLVLAPLLPWESLKVGGGTPPIRTAEGWLTYYHGVEGSADDDPDRKYHAGALLLALDNPTRVLYRSPQPVLSPESADETTGVVSNVVFPTGIVQQPDGSLDVYYGMADQAIGLATAYLPRADSQRDKG
jgi:beta-1,2-mannobiose phosphorylase / 1,2-beta-oligomannan phosphorylase